MGNTATIEKATVEKATMEKRNFLFAYIADGGGYVGVPGSMDPFRELGLSPSASPQQTKEAYRARASLPRR